MNINYPALLEEATLELVKKVLIRIENEGLSGEHHFYISFETDHPGVILSDRMKKYPEEITIVLQNQFEDLVTRQEFFSVKLSFNGIKEVIRVPFDSLTNFVDPSEKFSLQFIPKGILPNVDRPQTPIESQTPSSSLPQNLESNVIALDKFRNKTPYK
jgi:hypothetical protein